MVRDEWARPRYENRDVRAEYSWRGFRGRSRGWKRRGRWRPRFDRRRWDDRASRDDDSRDNHYDSHRPYNHDRNDRNDHNYHNERSEHRFSRRDSLHDGPREERAEPSEKPLPVAQDSEPPKLQEISPPKEQEPVLEPDNVPVKELKPLAVEAPPSPQQEDVSMDVDSDSEATDDYPTASVAKALRIQLPPTQLESQLMDLYVQLPKAKLRYLSPEADELPQISHPSAVVIASIKRRQAKVAQEMESARQQLVRHREKWMAFCTELDSKTLPTPPSKKTQQPDVHESPRQKHGRRNRSCGDAVRSEAEFMQILANLEMETAKDPLIRAQLTSVNAPRQIMDPIDAKSFFIDTNNQVKDPSTLKKRLETDNVDTFNEKEHQQFCEAYVQYPKQFGRISAAMGGFRTFHECVMHYYRTKKHVDYKLLLQKRKPKGRRGRKPKKIRADDDESAGMVDSEDKLDSPMLEAKVDTTPAKPKGIIPEIKSTAETGKPVRDLSPRASSDQLLSEPIHSAATLQDSPIKKNEEEADLSAPAAAASSAAVTSDSSNSVSDKSESDPVDSDASRPAIAAIKDNQSPITDTTPTGLEDKTERAAGEHNNELPVQTAPKLEPPTSEAVTADPVRSVTPDQAPTKPVPEAPLAKAKLPVDTPLVPLGTDFVDTRGQQPPPGRAYVPLRPLPIPVRTPQVELKPDEIPPPVQPLEANKQADPRPPNAIDALATLALEGEKRFEEDDRKSRKYRRRKDAAKPNSYWNAAEIRKFEILLAKFGTKWEEITKHLQSKTAIMLKNYYVKNKDTKQYEVIAKQADAKIAASGVLPVYVSADVDESQEPVTSHERSGSRPVNTESSASPSTPGATNASGPTPSTAPATTSSPGAGVANIHSASATTATATPEVTPKWENRISAVVNGPPTGFFEPRHHVPVYRPEKSELSPRAADAATFGGSNNILASTQSAQTNTLGSQSLQNAQLPTAPQLPQPRSIADFNTDQPAPRPFVRPRTSLLASILHDGAELPRPKSYFMETDSYKLNPALPFMGGNGPYRESNERGHNESI